MYAEKLPESCPPPAAVENALAGVYRRINKEIPVQDDFLSHHAKNIKPKTPTNMCKWASCSLFDSKDQIVNICSKLPRPRDYANFIAEMNIPEKSGRWLRGKKGHYDFWKYESFDLVSAVVKVEPVDG
jgi:hypothetical protein